MSRIGVVPITIPETVTINQKGDLVTVKGPKGIVTVSVPESIEVSIAGSVVQVKPKHADALVKNLHGLLRTLIQNAVSGTVTGWEKSVELVGVGYRASGGGRELNLTVGFSHPVKVTAPETITFTITDNTKITVRGVDKKLVGEIAAKLRAVRPPEPYKGKGIRYQGEVIRKKAGKAVKAAGAGA